MPKFWPRWRNDNYRKPTKRLAPGGPELPVSSLSTFPERLGSGDGERKTLLTRQIAFEPLPASVLFAFGCEWQLLVINACRVRLVVVAAPEPQG